MGRAYTFDGSSMDRLARHRQCRRVALDLLRLGRLLPRRDQSAGALEDHGGSWSERTLLGGGSTGMLSCASSTFCERPDENGRTFEYNGASWSPGASADVEGLRDLSCASEDFCVAVKTPFRLHGEGEAITFDGVSWSAPSADMPGGTASWISCASPTFCAAVGTDATIYDRIELEYAGAPRPQRRLVSPGRLLRRVRGRRILQVRSRLLERAPRSVRQR